jgi:hypothetical protein
VNIHLKFSYILYEMNQESRGRHVNTESQIGSEAQTIFVLSHLLSLLTSQSICTHVSKCLERIDVPEERLQFAILNSACAETANFSASFEQALIFGRAAYSLLLPDLEMVQGNEGLARSVYLNYITSLYR